MHATLREKVRRRSGGLCEYCCLPEEFSELRHVVDHVIAQQHGGKTTLANLALACGRCNRHKGPNISGVDPLTAQIARLFNPRNDRWKDHFRWRNFRLVGRTTIGRATVEVLAINHSYRITARQTLAMTGHPPRSR